MFASHGVWFLRTRGIRQRAKEAEAPYDELPEAIEWQEKAIKLDWSKIARFCSEKDKENNVECRELQA
jgi:hypothetical protein